MSEDEKGNLKLIVRNQEDLKVISAYSQDSIVAIKDITFLKKNRIFIMIINRFMWEDIERGINRQSKRIRCALKFEGILKVKSKKINQKNKNIKLLQENYADSFSKNRSIKKESIKRIQSAIDYL